MRGPHGFYPEEQLTGNEFIIDLYVSTMTTQAAMMDDLGRTVNYETLFLILQAEMRKPSKLIETLAERIVSRVQEYYEERVSGVRLRLRKCHPPLGGEVEAAFIEIETGSFGSRGGGGGGLGSFSGIFNDF
jgi:dihydroneopterin aldolase